MRLSGKQSTSSCLVVAFLKTTPTPKQLEDSNSKPVCCKNTNLKYTRWCWEPETQRERQSHSSFSFTSASGLDVKKASGILFPFQMPPKLQIIRGHVQGPSLCAVALSCWSGPLCFLSLFHIQIKADSSYVPEVPLTFPVFFSRSTAGMASPEQVWL